MGSLYGRGASSNLALDKDFLSVFYADESTTLFSIHGTVVPPTND
jgi:hypothetical protein